jgi:ubiquinone biosynthesis protein UbiJ
VLNQTLSAAINHLLEAECWARDKLRPHAGKTAVIHVGALNFSFAVGEAGLITPAPAAGSAGGDPALEVTLAPASLLDALRGTESALKSAGIHGDAEFAATVMFLVKNLRWDIEEDLSRVIGDIAAHRLVADAQSLVAWERDARGRLLGSMGDYLKNESQVLVTSEAILAFVADVDHLRDDAARLEKRLQQLAAGARKAAAKS